MPLIITTGDAPYHYSRDKGHPLLSCSNDKGHPSYPCNKDKGHPLDIPLILTYTHVQIDLFCVEYWFGVWSDLVLTWGVVTCNASVVKDTPRLCSKCSSCNIG